MRGLDKKPILLYGILGDPLMCDNFLRVPGCLAGSPVRAALGLALLMVVGPASAQAPPVQLQFGYRADPALAARTFFLRPNSPQEVFPFVKNDDVKPREMTVQLLVSGAAVASQKVKVAPGATEPARFGPPAPAAPAAGAPAAPVPPPSFVELKGPAAFRLLDETGKALGEAVPVEVARPSRYVEVPVIRYYPRSEDNPTNRLAVTLRVREKFPGRARVDLVLLPDRIPGLVPGQIQKGVYGGFLPGDGSQTLSLVAEDLKFSVPETKGLVYLTVDGYERAFTFDVTFSRDRTEGAPPAVTTPGLTLAAPDFAPPQTPVKVGLEIDNAPRNARIKLSVRTQGLVEEPKNSGKYILQARFNEVAEFQGDRFERLFFAPTGPSGGLLFRAAVSDWDAVLDMKAVYGDTILQAQMVREMPAQAQDRIIKVRNNRTNEPAERLYVRQDISLDATPPAGVRLVAPPKALIPGQAFTLFATTDEEVGKLSKVEFFQSPNPLVNNKLPPELVPIVVNPARLADVEKKLWAANLVAPRGQQGPIYVTVRFTKRNGLTAMPLAAAKIDVVELPPGPGGPAKPPASITGGVVQGDRPQPGITVVLQDLAGNPRGSTVTDAKGQFKLTDVLPGPYRLVATKTADNTRGVVAVQIAEGEQRVLAPAESIKLYRQRSR
jgi:Carboxypeptidase regulatory-like domain